MNTTLRAYNADYLLSEMAPQKRAEVAARLGNKLDGDLTELERELSWAVARQLAEDAVEIVRCALAESVKSCPYLPKDIGFKLAYDIESVAAPFLAATEIFSDAELCEIARSVSQNLRAVMAGRNELSSEVCDLLSEIGDRAVAESLVTNATARIDDAAFRILQNRFDGDLPLFEKMATRGDLDPVLARELLQRASAAVEQKLNSDYDVAPDFTNLLIEESRSDVMLQLAKATNAKEAENLAREMFEKSELTPNLCLSAIRGGNLIFFEAAIAVRTGIPIQNVERIMHEGGPAGVAKICDKAKIPAFLHSEIAEAVEKILNGNSRPSKANG